MLLASLVAVCMAYPVVAADARIADVRAVQATFLFHFTRFVEWPPSAFESHDEPFRICVIGEDPFGDHLDRVVRDERAEGRTIRVERYSQPRSARGCQIAYLGSEVGAERLRDLPGFEEGLVLTVGEGDSFLEHGGMVRFVVREGNVGLAVNDQARERSHLHMSSKLLRLSELHRPEPEPELDPESRLDRDREV